MKQKTKIYFKLGILLFGISLCVVNCQQDDLISNYQLKKSETEITVKKLSLRDLQQKQKLQKPLQKLAKVFDINRSKSSSIKRNSSLNSKVDANDDSFTILTDEIVQVTTDSTETYSFLIETPTDATSEFENFIIDVKDDSIVDYLIMRYERLINSIDNFPYKIYMQNVSNNIIDIESLNLFERYEYQFFGGECFIVHFDVNDDPLYVEPCPTTGGGSGASGVGFTGNNGGYFGDNGGSDGSDSTSGGSGGDGTSTSPSSNDSAPFGIVIESNYKNEVIECLGGESNLTPEQLAWLNSSDSNIQYILKQMAHYINHGGCNVMNSIILDFIDNPTNDFVDFVDQELECYGINNLTTNVYFNQALSNLQGYSLNHPTEEGYEVSMSSNGAVISTNYVHGYSGGIKLNNGGNIIGGMHLHTNKGENMFSGEDVFNLLQLGANVSDENSFYDCFSVLDTANGTYMIKISNLINLYQIFYQLGNGNLRKGRKRLNRKLEYFDNTDETAVEREFLSIFKNLSENYNFNRSPINFFKYNDTTNTFNKLELDDNGQPDTQPCN